MGSFSYPPQIHYGIKQLCSTANPGGLVCDFICVAMARLNDISKKQLANQFAPEYIVIDNKLFLEEMHLPMH